MYDTVMNHCMTKTNKQTNLLCNYEAMDWCDFSDQSIYMCIFVFIFTVVCCIFFYLFFFFDGTGYIFALFQSTYGLSP